MAVVVVCGNGRGAGKTALICGLIATLPEYEWTVVKMTDHAHGIPEPVWEECEAGEGTDTARYLASGAKRALLVTATDEEFAQRLGELWEKLEPGADVIFESNRVLEYVRPDVCLAVVGEGEAKPLFDETMQRAHAWVVRKENGVEDDSGKRIFQENVPEVISEEMRAWLRECLRNVAQAQK